ncbi:MAG: helix-turn-helix domain-containing protein [Intrasporangium sp.]|uniref:antitoxin Xre/MbcA/ParS toxin-binding domain-containing protein n=1 Tax=Intrasporangium sp. TaxID=1925024 RepID=UPI0026493464|nr:antitoxin Xre/MbcA/ParS toxin-binding domain-containing protein [Intrasporangium sp.]MDN5797837.1 helix-turn-helix domain-containing protein [Intrasporangium sp.]
MTVTRPQPRARTKKHPITSADAESLTMQRTEFLVEALGGITRLAELLDVSKSQPSRWRSGKEQPSPAKARELIDLDHVLARATLIWESEVAIDWLFGSNSYLDGARPIDVLRVRGSSEVLDALDAAAAGAFG